MGDKTVDIVSLHHCYQQFENALDELQSQITPEQFSYLVSLLSSSSVVDSLSESLSVTAATNTEDTIFPQGSSWSPNKVPRSTSSGSNSSSRSDKQITLQKQQRKRSQESHQRIQINPRDLTQSVNRLSQPSWCSKPNRGLIGLPHQLASFESTVTATNTGGDSVISRRGVTSKGSVSALELEESLLENVVLAQRNFDRAVMSLVPLQDPTPHTAKTSLDNIIKFKPCSQLPVCKRLSQKYMIMDERKSRSSSVESVKADSLPDINNPLLNIAGKIANEPINPFPILKIQTPFRKASHPATSSSSTSKWGAVASGIGKVFSALDVQKTEQEIDRELGKFQDYTNLREFFSQNKQGNRKARNPEGKGGVCNLSRRVTNPLYKEYDPSGYHKTEDELATECIQIICDDFNKWIKFLASSNKKNEVESENEQQELAVEDETFAIGPEFLLKILRQDLEFPNTEANE